MPSYSYKAVNEGGVSVEGMLTAENYQVALRMLDEQALYPVKVAEGIEHKGLALGARRKVKSHHLTRFYSQLADLLRAGVPMLRSLDVLGKQGSHGALTQVIRELREDVAGGSALGDSMAKHPHAFSPLHASMVKAGEQGGFLEDVLQRIAIFSEKQDELRNKLIGSLIYPCILVFVGTAVILVLMLVVVPRLREHLRQENLNFMSHIVFGACDILIAHYGVLLVGFVAVAAGVSAWIKTESGKRTFELLKLRAPVFGKVFTMVALCRFCRILGTLLHNGVPILQSLSISKDSAGSDVLAGIIDDARDSVKKGATLSQPLGETGLFPSDIVDMIAVAEEGNNLESVLIQIADTNEVRTGRQIDLAVRIFEPVLLVIMASLVFCILVALLLPILTMGSAGIGK
ncbi:MAG: type II secretion system F family protein [Phycisphaerae bacterium]